MRSSGILALSLLCAFGIAIAAYAQTSSTMSEINGATTGLGTSHRFKTPDAAAAHCPDDIVVWSSGPGTTYLLPSAPTYGKSTGFYACKMEADSAGFQPK
jgi:hypothetical protein